MTKKKKSVSNSKNYRLAYNRAEVRRSKRKLLRAWKTGLTIASVLLIYIFIKTFNNYLGDFVSEHNFIFLIGSGFLILLFILFGVISYKKISKKVGGQFQ